LKPDYIRAFTNLSTIKKYTEVGDIVPVMEDLYYKKGETTNADRIDLGFALGKAEISTDHLNLFLKQTD